jgi:putative two-component system response regulator
MDDAAIKQARILIVDDQEVNVRLLEGLLEVSGYTNVLSTSDSTEVVGIVGEQAPDLILLDLQMPVLSGFDVMELLQPWIHGTTRLPILMLTADSSREAKSRALSAGASDFLNKPFDPTEVELRIRNLLEVRLLQLQLHEQNKGLEQRVQERTRDLEEARLEIIERLALAAEYRDDATGEHTQRVGRTSALIARGLGLPQETVELIHRAAPLHDVGKLGVSDSILLKPGKLTPDEFEVMKFHVTIGSEILTGSRSPLLQIGAEIARTHHEHWDGDGYLIGLKGEGIPIEGRIVAVADVFDALTHKRPYKDAWPIEQALAEIRTLSGRQFDPRVVEVFAALPHEALLESVEELELVA